MPKNSPGRILLQNLGLEQQKEPLDNYLRALFVVLVVDTFVLSQKPVHPD